MMSDWQEKQAIYEQLCRYCRGLDRMDKAMAYSVWMPDSTVNYYGMYEGSGPGFVDWVWQSHEFMERHSHQIANHLVELQGDKASSECYVTVVLWTLPDADGAQQEIRGVGRYLDQWNKSDGRWLIARREFVLDMQRSATISDADRSELSRRDGDDPSFNYIPRWN